MRRELDDDAIIVAGITNTAYWSNLAFPVLKPRNYITSSYFATLGFAFPTAIGAKIGNPDKQVVALCGDGGFMFGIPDLATAVQEGANLVALVFNDGAYGNVKRCQKHVYDNRIIGSELHNPDFVKLAESFGAQGLRAASPEALRQAIRRGFDTKGPTVIEIPVGEMPDPWSFVLLPRVRGKGSTDRVV